MLHPSMVNSIAGVAFLAGLLLVFVLAVSALAAYSRARAGELSPEAIRSRTGVYFIGVDFVLILAILLWRAGCG